MRGLIAFLAVMVAVVVQVTVVDRIGFPGGTGPDLVLLAVAAFALAGGPAAGAFIGFCGGLALDVAPPGSHFIGQNALVFCLVGYLCGMFAARGEPAGFGGTGSPPKSRGGLGGIAPPEAAEHTALFEIVVMAAAAVCGEALTAALGKMLSDPRVSVPAVRHVLPAAVAYDVLLCPFVLFAAAAVLRLGDALRPARDQSGRISASQAANAPRPVAASSAVCAVREVPGGLNGPTPRLRLSARGRGENWVADRGTTGRKPAGREPRLKLGRGTSTGGSALGRGSPLGGSALGAAFAAGGAAKVRFGSRRGAGALGGSMLGGLRPAGPAWGPSGAGLGGFLSGDSRLGRSRFGRSRMGRSLFGGSVFSRSPSSALSARVGRPSPLAARRFTAPRFAMGRRYRPPGGPRRQWRPGKPRRYRPPGGPRRQWRPGKPRRQWRPGKPRRQWRPGKQGAPARLTGALRRSARGRSTGAVAAAGAVRKSAPRRSAFRGPGLGTAALPKPTRCRSPGTGWLRRSPGTGWLRGRRLRRGAIGSSTPRLSMGRKSRKSRKPSWRTGGFR